MNPHDKWCVQVYVLVEMFTFPWSDPKARVSAPLVGQKRVSIACFTDQYFQ